MLWDGADLASGGASFPHFRLYGETEGDGFGRDIAMGEINGDGFDELLVGAPDRLATDSDGTAAYQGGSLYIYQGREGFSGWLPNLGTSHAEATYVKAEPYLSTGQMIRTGDFDQDGHTDLALLQRYRPN